MYIEYCVHVLVVYYLRVYETTKNWNKQTISLSESKKTKLLLITYHILYNYVGTVIVISLIATLNVGGSSINN